METRDSKNRPPIGVKPDEATYDEIEDLCVRLDRKRAYIALKLIKRGLAAFRRDGLLTEPASGGRTAQVESEALAGRKSTKKANQR